MCFHYALHFYNQVIHFHCLKKDGWNTDTKYNLSFRRMKSKVGRCGLTPGAVGLSSSLQLLTITSITSHLLRTLHYNASHIHVTSITSLHAHYITARHIFIDHCGQLTICITLYIPPLPKYPVCSAPYNTPYIYSVAKMTPGSMYCICAADVVYIEMIKIGLLLQMLVYVCHPVSSTNWSAWCANCSTTLYDANCSTMLWAKSWVGVRKGRLEWNPPPRMWQKAPQRRHDTDQLFTMPPLSTSPPLPSSMSQWRWAR